MCKVALVVVLLLASQIMAWFASLKKQVETLFRLICYERKTLFQLKKQKLKKTNYKRSEHGHVI